MDIRELEKELVKDKEWKHMGEVDTSRRPKNSLLKKMELDFDTTQQFVPISTKQNNEIMKVTIQRLREGTFDNYKFTEQDIKVEEDEIEEYTEDNKDIEELYNEIKSDLTAISDFGCFGYMPDVKVQTVKIPETNKKKKLKAQSLGKIKNVTVLK